MVRIEDEPTRSLIPVWMIRLIVFGTFTLKTGRKGYVCIYAGATMADLRQDRTQLSVRAICTIRLQILNSPLFSLFQYISPLFRENYYFPLLLQFSTLIS